MKKHRQQYSKKQKYPLLWDHVKTVVSESWIIQRTTLAFIANTYAHRTLIFKYKEVSLEKLPNSFKLLFENVIKSFWMRSIIKQRSVLELMRC